MNLVKEWLMTKNLKDRWISVQIFNYSRFEMNKVNIYFAKKPQKTFKAPTSYLRLEKKNENQGEFPVVTFSRVIR